MPYTTFSSGAVLTASQLNTNLRDQVVTPFATTAARDAAITSPVEGMVCVITGEDRLYVYDGAAWQRGGNYSSTGRTGASVSRAANQSIPNITLTTITFDSVAIDSDAYHSGATFTQLTIPTGLGGLYLISGYVVWGSALSSSMGIVLTLAGTDHTVIPTAAPILALSVLDFCAIQSLVPTNTIGLRVYQGSGGAVNATAQLFLQRLMI